MAIMNTVRERLIKRANRKMNQDMSHLTTKELKQVANYHKAAVTSGRGYKLAIQAYGFEGFIQRVRDARLMSRIENPTLRWGIAQVVKDARRATARVNHTEEQRLVILARELFGDTEEATVEALRLALVRTRFLKDK